MKLATTTADFKSYAVTPADQVRLFEGTGFRFLDLNLYESIYANSPFLDDRWQQWIDDAGEAAAALGIKFCQAHAPNGDPHSSGEEQEVFARASRRAIEACSRLAIPAIVVHLRDIGGFPSRENRRLNLQHNRDFIRRLIPAMEAVGVRVLIENSCDRHAPTPRENIRHVPSTAAELLEIVEFIDHPLVGVCWDTGHGHIQGVNPYQSILELGPALWGVHVADNYGDQDSHVAPFQGTLNLDAVMQGLLDIDYQGYFTFEAGQILRHNNAWPHFRDEWSHHGQAVTRLINVPLELKRQAVALLYQIGKHVLTEYGCFEA